MSPGDPASDARLVELAAALARAGGEQADHARFDLLSAQVRSYVASVLRAQQGARQSVPASGAPAAPSGSRLSGHAGDSGPAGFRPSPVLVRQIGVVQSCGTDEEADDCAGAMADALITRIDEWTPSAAMMPLRNALYAAVAPFQPNNIDLTAEARWEVLSRGTDAASRLAQVVTYGLLRARIAQSQSANAAPAAALADVARTASEIGIGGCATAYARLSAQPLSDATVAQIMTALVQGRCVPECAQSALAAGGADPIAAAALTCRVSASPVAFGLHFGIGHTIDTWLSSTQTALESLRSDPLFAAALEASTGSGFALQAPAFLAGNGRSIAAPAVATSTTPGLGFVDASYIVWLAEHGDPMVTIPEHFGVGASPPGGDALGLRVLPATALRASLTRGETSPPVAIAIDAVAQSGRLMPVLDALAPAAGSDDIVLVTFVLRHGPLTRYVPVRLARDLPDVVFRVGERQLSAIEHGVTVRSAQVTQLTPNDDTLGGIIPGTPPSGAVGLELAHGTTGATFARVLDAVVAYAASGTTGDLVALSIGYGEGPSVTGTGLSHTGVRAMRTEIETHRAEILQRCMSDIPASADGSASVVDLHLVVDPRGRVRGVGATGSSPALTTAARCVSRRAREWHLPNADAAADVHVDYAVERDVAPSASAAPASVVPSASAAAMPSASSVSMSSAPPAASATPAEAPAQGRRARRHGRHH